MKDDELNRLVEAERKGVQARLAHVPGCRERAWYRLSVWLKRVSDLTARWSRACEWKARGW